MKKSKSLLLKFDRILSQGLFKQILLLVALLFVIFIISFLLLSLSGSDWITYCHNNHISKWVFPFYLLIDGNAFHDFCSDEIVGALPVFLACLIYIVGVIIFTGMIISIMTNMIERRVENHREGHIHYLKSGHYIIMGYDDIVPSFIKYIFDEKDSEAYVLILTAVKVSLVTEKLSKSFDKNRMEHIIVNYGHRTTDGSYEDIHLESAEEVFIVGLNSMPAHDAVNVECADSICHYLETRVQKPRRITCVFKDLDTYSAFKTSEIFGKIKKQGIEFVPYNLYTRWGKRMFVNRTYKNSRGIEYDYPAVFGNGIAPNDSRYVHLVFVGTSNFAVALALEAAQVLHFPNYSHNPNLKTRITFLDLNADKEMNEFVTRNRHFFEVQSHRYQDLSDESKNDTVKVFPPTCTNESNDFLDVEFEFIKGDFFAPKVQKEIRKWACAKDEQYLSIFLAVENQRNNFVMGMNMPDEVYDNEIPIFIRQDRSDIFVTNLRKEDSRLFKYTTINTEGKPNTTNRKARYANIYPFGMNEAVYAADDDDKSLQRAMLINYLYNTADYKKYKFTSFNDLNNIPTKTIWGDAKEQWWGWNNENKRPKLPVYLQWSNLYNSYTIETKMASLRAMRGLAVNDTSNDTKPLTDDEVEELAKVEHNRWNVEKLLMGFRRPLTEEDCFNAKDKSTMELLAENRKLFIHHDIRPYDDLDEVKELDREFSRYLPWIIEMTEKIDEK